MPNTSQSGPFARLYSGLQRLFLRIRGHHSIKSIRQGSASHHGQIPLDKRGREPSRPRPRQAGRSPSMRLLSARHASIPDAWPGACQGRFAWERARHAAQADRRSRPTLTVPRVAPEPGGSRFGLPEAQQAMKSLITALCTLTAGPCMQHALPAEEAGLRYSSRLNRARAESFRRCGGCLHFLDDLFRKTAGVRIHEYRYQG